MQDDGALVLGWALLVCISKAVKRSRMNEAPSRCLGFRGGESESESGRERERERKGAVKALASIETPCPSQADAEHTDLSPGCAVGCSN